MSMPCLSSLWDCGFSLSLSHSVEMRVSLWVNVWMVANTKDSQDLLCSGLCDDRQCQSLVDLLDLGAGSHGRVENKVDFSVKEAWVEEMWEITDYEERGIRGYLSSPTSSRY